MLQMRQVLLARIVDMKMLLMVIRTCRRSWQCGKFVAKFVDRVCIEGNFNKIE
jgi:hypothetical protein